MTFIVGTALLAIVTALACALPGVFVVLRRNSMVADAISHAVFPGIVVGYFFTESFDSPLLILGAAIAGLIVVLGTQWLEATGLLTGDAPQGLIFPALFSVGVIIVTAHFSNVHLDVHAVLVGDLNLAAWNQLEIGQWSFGPSYLYVMLGVLMLNALFIALFFNALKVTTFDPSFARSIGLRCRLLNTAFMFLVSVTITAAFNAVGAILVVALVVVPAATASLVSRRLVTMIAVALAVAAAGAVAGFWVSYQLGAATSAGMAVFYGMLFLLVLIARTQRARVRGRARAGASQAPRVTRAEPNPGREAAGPA